MTRLDDMFDALWRGLDAGVKPGPHPFSMVYLATDVGGAPDIRTVVLRRADRAAGSVGFNTDLRSPKIAALRTTPRVALLAYDRDAGVQARLAGDAALLTGDAARPAWRASAAQSRICYRHAYAPGAPLDDPAPADPTRAMTHPADEEEGFENFCAVEIALSEIEWLDLAATGHRRAKFTRVFDAWTGGWIAP